MLNRFFHLLTVLTPLLLANAPSGQGPKFYHRQGGRISGVFFLNDTHGWSSEDGARVRYSQNGGLDWQYGFTPDNFREELTDVYFVDTSNGWAVSVAGSVLRSTNGGVTWNKINATTLVDTKGAVAKLNTIFMFDTSNGWAGGDDGALWSTNSGGVFWSQAPNPPPDFVFDALLNPDPEDAYKIRFWDSMKGYMVADYGSAYSTTTGGASWVHVNVGAAACQLPPHSNLELWDFDFGDSLTHGLLAGGVGLQDSFLFKTEDGGLTWQNASCFDQETYPGDCTAPTTYGVARAGTWPRGVAVGYASVTLAHQIGAAAGHDQCLCAPPGAGPCATAGASWVRADPYEDFSPPLFAAARIGSTNKVCYSGAFGILRILDAVPPYFPVDKGTVNYTRLEGGDFISATTGCVLGQAYTIRRTADSGGTWTQVYPPLPTLPDPLDGWGRDLDFSSAGDKGVAVGDDGFVVWSEDYGQTWSPPLTPPPGGGVDYQAVAFAPFTNIVHIGGVGGLLRRSFDGGKNWSTLLAHPVTTETILGIAFADANHGYAVGTNQVALQTSNGGNSWTPVGLVGGVPGETLHAVATWGDGTPAVAVGSDGLVYAKSGAQFVLQNLGAMAVQTDLTDVAVFNAGANVRICGLVGMVLFRDNGTWSQPKSQTNEDLTGLSFESSNTGYCIGRPFLITRYE